MLNFARSSAWPSYGMLVGTSSGPKIPVRDWIRQRLDTLWNYVADAGMTGRDGTPESMPSAVRARPGSATNGREAA